MIRVGLTGNIAAGKSAVTEFWRSLGVPVIDADVLARSAVEPGTPGFDAVVREFGTSILTDNRINRSALRKVVFKDAKKRKKLEAIIHPEVARLRAEQEAALAAQGTPIVVNDIPLLFEAGMQNDFDVLVLVDAPEELRIARIAEQRGLSDADARKMIAAQMDPAEKRKAATYVIDNDATLQALHERARRVWADIAERA